MAPSSRRSCRRATACASAEGLVCTAGCMTAHCPRASRRLRGDSAWRNCLPAWSDAPGFSGFPEWMDPLQEYLAKPWLEYYQPGVRRPSSSRQSRCSSSSTKLLPAGPARCAGLLRRGITYGELRDATDRLAWHSPIWGVKKGDGSRSIWSTAAVRDRLFRRAEMRRRCHQHQPALHEPRVR